MSKMQQVLNEEIRRGARREISGMMKQLKAQISGLRNQVRELSRRVKVLEKSQPKAASEPVMAEAEMIPAKSLRITAERIKKWRKKLNLSQGQYAALLGVNAISVNHWENGKAVPRTALKQKIAFLRDAGSRRIVELLAEKNIEVRKKTVKKVAGAAKKKARSRKAGKSAAKA